VLAGSAVEVAVSEGATGPASVVRVVDNPEMMFAAERIAARLELSGFFGLDFMIADANGGAYLIEMNPRCTPLTHLRLGEGRDLVGALWAQLADRTLPKYEAITQSDRIAYFPQAGDAMGEPFASTYYDVPLGEPELADELRDPWLNHTLVHRLLAVLHWMLNKPAVPARRIELKTYAAPDYAGRTVTRETLSAIPVAPASSPRQLL
jgi:hypothetical protein